MDPTQGFVGAVADGLSDMWANATVTDQGATVPNPVSLATNPIILAALSSGYSNGAATFSVAWNPRPQNAIDYARARAAEMVGMRLLPNGRLVPNPNPKWSIQDSTRDMLRQLTEQALEGENASTPRDLKALIEQLPAFAAIFGEYRAEMIARSELMMANNSGNLDMMESTGVPMVYVLDNAQCKICGPVAGTTQTLEWARDNLLGHPNCQRAFNAVKQKDVGGISVGTGLTGYRLEGQRCPLNCRNGKRPNGNACPHKSHTRQRES